MDENSKHVESGKPKKMSENEQVEMVFLKFGLAQTDQELEMAVDRFLPLILKKISTEDEKIRAKVLQLLTHISNRLKSRAEVKLPVEKLLDLYCGNVSTFIMNFTIIYIKMGYPRLSVQKQTTLAPKLFTALEGKPITHQDSLIRLLVGTFPNLKLPESPDKRKTLFDFEKYPASTKRLLEFCLDVLLMPYSASATSSSETLRPSTAPAGNRSSVSPGGIPPGLSLYSVKRLAGDSPESSWNVAEIESIKGGILNLFSGGVFTENDIAVHLIVASSDPKHTVCTSAEMELRKCQGTLDWSSASLVTTLYRLYLGDAVVRPTSKKGQKSSATQRKAVSLRTKLKIVQMLMRSRSATEKFPLTVQLVYDTLFSAGTSSRLNVLGLEFVHHICDSCELPKLLPQAPLLLDAMVKTTQGFEGENRIRGLAYTALGKLSRRVPKLFSSNLKLVQDSFDALAKENAQELKLYIQESLAMMSEAYGTVAIEHLPLVEAIIAKYISDQDHLCRLAAVRYAGVVFSSDHVSSRYLLFLAASDVKEDVASEAKRLLYGTESNILEGKKELDKGKPRLPHFRDILNFVHDKAKDRLRSSKRFVIGSQSIAFPPSTFLVLLQYLRKCLLEDSIANSSTKQSERELVSQSPVIAEYMKLKWDTDQEEIVNLMAKFMNLIFQFLRAVTDTDAAYIMLETFAVCPDDFPLDVLLSGSRENKDPLKEEERKSLILSRREWIKGLIGHTRDAIREYGAELYSIVLKRSRESDFNYESVVADLLSGAESEKNFEKTHGSILTLGHVLGDVLSNVEEMVPQEVRDALICLARHVLARDTTIASAACFALGEVSRKAALPLPDGQVAARDEDKEKDDKEKMAVTKDLTKYDVANILLGHLKSSTVHKLRERSVVALGCLPVGDPTFPHTEHLLERLLASSEIKETDLHFTVASALCSIALGSRSPVKRNKWKQRVAMPTESQDFDDNSKVAWLLQKILSEYIGHRIPAVRQASCVWLLTMLKTDEMACLPEVQKALPELQSAFMALLSEADDLIQDVASKGLGVVYELGSEEQKKQLVDGLVTSLTGGVSSTTKANQHNLFQGSTGIGKAPDGSNLSTYKEICSLASDLNQPDLVYKFLHLAKHNALWNSKKGAAFGFSNIASLASEQLAPHLPRIVPRLYRYTFDPQSGVRSAMTSIWNALSADPKKLVDKYLGPIIEDLKRNLASNMWRTRQASCLAVADLLQGGRGLSGGEEGDIIVSSMPELWTANLRVMDDIKETVRDAATVASKSLKKTTIRLCNHDQGKQGEKAVAKILPVLLKEGLLSRVKEVKALSLATLGEISKKSGKLIKCCIPEMIIALLEALSEFEPRVLNYLAVRSDADGREALDLARAEAVKSSPMVETIDRCLMYSDSETLTQLIPSVTELTRKNAGIMTKAGCSHVIISLVNTCNAELTPHAASLLNALTTGLTDSSLAMRKCNAHAAGNVVRVAKEATVAKFISKLKSWYLEKEDDIHRHAAALACHAIGKHSPGILRDHVNVILPLAFVGMHESKDENGNLKNKDSESSNKEDKNSSQYMWKDLWTEFTPGTATAIKLYLDEIIAFSSSSLQSSQWKMKSQAAAAMATVARQQREGTIAGPQLRKLVEILLHGLQGRTWDGKEQLLVALSAVAVHCKAQLRIEEVTSILTLLFKECSREKLAYKTEAVHSLGSVLEAHGIDKFTHFWEIIAPILNRDSKNDSDSEDETKEEQSKTSSAKLKLLETAIQACGKAWPCTKDTQDKMFVQVGKILAQHIRLGTWNIQYAALQSTRKIFNAILKVYKADSSNMETDEQLTSNKPVSDLLNLEATELVDVICISLGNAKYSRIREESLAATQVLVSLFKGRIFLLSNGSKLVEALQKSPLTEKRSIKKTQVDELVKKLKEIIEAS